MRKLLSFTVAAAILSAGIYLLIVHAFSEGTIYGKVLVIAGSLIGVGGWWLWADFIGPALGKQVQE